MMLVTLFTTQVAMAEKTSNPQVITDLLNRIGGSGAAARFETAINTDLAGEKFIIGSLNDKPYVEGTNAIAVATGINWYLNHYAHINLTWNKLSTDLVNASLPLPGETIEKASAVDLRYYLNYCTYSYTCAMWTEERWMQEIDWMALHGINMPLMLVGLDCVWYDLYTKSEYGYNYTAEEISNYIAGPAFQAWWGMINCEGHGGPNPAWWYERSRALAQNMLARMRAYGMEPVLPGFCGEVPSNLKGKLNDDSEINTGGKWQGFAAPGLMGHKSTNWATLAANFYDALKNVMGTSKYYSMDPFHEGATGLTGSSASNKTEYFQSCYAQMKKNVGEGVVWVAQDWGTNPTDEMLDGLKKGEMLVLDLFAEADPHYSGGYNEHDYVYCMLLNFGGRVGLHGRFNKVVDNYYKALAARGNEMVGIGATPEGVECNPMLYDILFELPWRETAPDKTEWVNNYTVSRYGQANEGIKAVYQKLMQSVYNCTTGQQGTSEPIICAIPDLAANKVSSWSTAAVDYDHDIVIAAADGMLAEMENFASSNDNFNYDLLDVVRQALTNYALDFLGQLNGDYTANGFDATFRARKDYYLALIEDIDRLLGTHQKFRLGNWAEMARAIVTETAAASNGAGEADADWLEYNNLRRQITTWAPFESALRDYSNREWHGLVKDYYLERWKIYFNALENGTAESLNGPYWYNYGNTYVFDNTKTYRAAPEGDTKTIASELFNKYFMRDTDAQGRTVYFNRHLKQSKTAAEYVKYAYRGEEFTFEIPAGTTATMSIDANNDGIFGDGETVAANTMTIPANAATTTVKALIVLSDNTEISFNLFIADNIENPRTVSVQAGDNGSVSIEGADGSSVTNTEYVTMVATGNSGYDFSHWVLVADDGSETEASRENPFTYLGKDAATFKAYFIQNIWGIPGEDWGDRNDIAAKQYLTSITCTQGENTQEIYTAAAATENLFVPVGTMINAAKGSCVEINWQGDGNMKYSYLSAYIDLNRDGDFVDEGELLMVKGTLDHEDASVETGPLAILLPYDMPEGITHIRLRFDGAWKSGYDATTKAFPAKNTINRRCYEIVLNVTEHAAGSSHIVITSNNAEWGYVRNITGVTGEDIDVPSGTEICMEAFPNEGYHFVHWLDKYDRVASTDAGFYYTPAESGEFTAIFAKDMPESIVFDGWEFEYRTVPGSELKVKGALANGVKPENGKTYYIYAPTSYNSVSATRYLYDNNGTLKTSETANGSNYVWTCIVNDDDTYSFQNASGKYLANNGSYHISIGATAAKYYLEDPTTTGCALKNAADYTGGKYMVTKHDGSAFNRNSGKTNGEWCSDYVFTEVSVPEVVILTNIRKSGDHDLEIPSEVEILGEQCSIVGFDNNLFNNNKDLWSISLPATIESMSDKTLFSTSVKGTNTPTSDSETNPDAIVQVIDLGGIVLKNNEPWEIIASYESDGVSTYNQWGTPLLYVGSAGNGTELFYLSNVNNWSSCWHVRSPFSDLGNDYFKTHTDTKISTFTVALENKGTGKAVLKVTNSEGAIQTSSEVTFSDDNIKAFSAKLPKGLNITEFKVLSSEIPDPFAGCTNLMDITIAQGCENYYVSERALYATDGDVKLHELPAEENTNAIRALGELIDAAKALVGEVAASVNPTGKSTALTLTTTEGSAFYVSTNADQNTGGGDNDGGGIAALVDNNEGTYFHSRWGGAVVSEPHYIQVDLGADNLMDYFKFTFKPRNGSPTPTAMTVYGSNDGSNFTDVLATINSGMPAHNSGTTYESSAIDSKRYRYLRFTVTASVGPGNNQYNSQYFFGMLEFDIYELTSTAEVKGVYANLAGVIASEVEPVYDRLADALYLYNNGGTATELQAAHAALEYSYNYLNEKKDKVFNGVYNINFDGGQVFVGYTNAAISGLSNDAAGYKLFDAIVDNSNNADIAGSTSGDTAEGLKELQNNAIAAKVAADALFTIVPNSAATGYSISAQGLYLHSTRNGGWAPLVLSADATQAGVYLFEETETASVYKLKSDRNDIQYVNDWGPVFGNDKSDKDTGLSKFTLTPVTEYTLAVPESGVTTLCLPFNVVLPAGVAAYDLAKANITKKKNYSTYKLVQVAAENETLAANTPVIVKAEAGDHILAITMDDEGAKVSVQNSVLRSGIVKTTVAAGNNYTFDGVDFNIVTANTEIPANQCWMALDENLGAKVYGSAPAYVLTTDEANPVLYKIIIKRANDGSKVLAYDNASGQVAVQAKDNASSWQAWYFMNGTDGVKIKPFNADGKVLGAANTGNGAGKVSAVENATYDDWVILKQGTEGYYNIKTAENGAYFSNYGGESNKMGFWNGDGNESKTQNDGGSLFKFVDAEFADDNARYYQLMDVRAITEPATYYKGESVGLYTEESVNDYNTRFATADELLAGTSATSASADCYAAYKALRAANEVPVYNAPAADKVYYIVSASGNNYCSGKYVHTYTESHIHENASWGDKEYDQRHLLYNEPANISQLSLAAFRFVETGVQGEYKVQNLHTGLYVKSFAADTDQMVAEADAAIVKVAGYADGQVTLKIGDNAPMHAQENYSAIVEYQAEPGGASLWTINEATDLNYTLTVPESGVATLYLPYNVVLPAGVTAYTVEPAKIVLSTSGSYSYELTQVATEGQVLAKGTAVVIKADEGDYEFAVSLDDTDAVGAASSALAGTCWATEVNSEDATKRYSATVENGNLVFVAITASTPVAANTCWLETTVDTDKIGAPGEVQATEILDGVVYRIKGRLSDGTLRTLYTNGGNERIKWTTDEKTDNTTLFIAQKVGEKFKFVSALGNGIWSQEATLSEEGVELTVSEGSVNGTFMIVGNNGRRFCVDADNLDYFSNVGDKPAGEYVNETVTTDFVFEPVENATVGYTLSMKSNSKWATLYLPYAVTVPEGLVAYYPHTPNVAGKVVALLDLEGVVPAYTPVVIGRSEAVAASATTTTNYEFAYTTDECSVDVSGYGQVLFGKFIDSYVAEAGKNCYVILTIGEKEAFYWIYKEYNAAGAYVGNDGDHIKCSANKAYMALEPVQSASYFSMAFEGTTDIDGVVVDGNAPESIYDIQGRKITEITSPGIYIINGKATVVK